MQIWGQKVFYGALEQIVNKEELKRETVKWKMETERHLNPSPISKVISNYFFFPIFHFPVLSLSIILNKFSNLLIHSPNKIK